MLPRLACRSPWNFPGRVASAVRERERLEQIEGAAGKQRDPPRRRQPGRLPEIGLHALQVRRDLSPEGALQLLALQAGERFADAVFDLDEILAARPARRVSRR